MIDDRDNPNRLAEEPVVSEPLLRRDFMGRKIPVEDGTGLGILGGLLAIALIVGGIFWFTTSTGTNTTTASNDRGSIVKSVPQTPMPTPAPATNPTPKQ